MKTAVALTPENTAVLAWCSELTGLPAEELINFFLAEYFENFNEDNQDNFCEETIGLLKFKDRRPHACVDRKTCQEGTQRQIPDI
jgi:hypothetical protein